MSEATLGKIVSEPNEKGEHRLRCPECLKDFASTIVQDDVTGVIRDTACLICDYSGEPKLFIAAAHQQEVNSLATKYVQNELKKSFGKWFK